MRFREIFIFELKYQFRQLSTWIVLAIPVLLSVFLVIMAKPSEEADFLNSPAFLVLVSVAGGVIWLLTSGVIAGTAAARDVQSRMDPLIYTTPLSKIDYLGGRFSAVLIINAFIQFLIPVSFGLAFLLKNADPTTLAPFQVKPFLNSYFYLSLPIAFVGTACQFSAAVLERKAIAAYIATALVFPITSHFGAGSLGTLSGDWSLVGLVDLVGLISILPHLETLTPFQSNTFVMKLEGLFLLNRIIWLSIAAGCLSYVYLRFSFSHEQAGRGWLKILRKKPKLALPERDAPGRLAYAISNPSEYFETASVPSFNFYTHVRQFWEVAWTSFKMIAKRKPVIPVVILFAFHLVLFSREYLTMHGVPQYAAAMNVLTALTASLQELKTPLIIVPLLILYFSGELIWVEREAGVDKILNTTPAFDWTLFLGKFFGLIMIVMLWLIMLVVAGALMQLSMGYSNFQIDVFMKALFGFQFIDYALFALLALSMHVIVNQKYLGLLVTLMLYLFMGFAHRLGVDHNLIIYAGGPKWSYTDMRGFEPNFWPWLSFKLYWVVWAVLLAISARLLWARNTESSIAVRARVALNRFRGTTRTITAVTASILIAAGSFIFYNTNILNDYASDARLLDRQASYELAYGKYRNVSQPRLTRTNLRVELYPDRYTGEIRGTYTLVNLEGKPIDSIHVATMWAAETSNIDFDKSYEQLSEDLDLGHSIYLLKTPLLPGDSMRMTFSVKIGKRGFSNTGKDPSIIPNGTYFINYDWLPSIGYQENNELRDDGQRRKYGLAPQIVESPDNLNGKRSRWDQHLVQYEATIGTAEGQTAVTAGLLLKQWKENGRSYFQYATSAPIKNTYSFLSAHYALRESTWTDSASSDPHSVTVKLFYHPAHSQNTDRILNSVNASLTYFSKQFGAYPYRHITLTERSGYPGYLNAEPSAIDFGESFTLSNQAGYPSLLDVTYFGIAHEVSHQWWGAAQLLPARMPGAGLLSESLANYSGLSLMRKTFGEDQVRKLLNMWRDAYEIPRSQATPPLLQATDRFLAYRKGPLALFALSQYGGRENIDTALRQLCGEFHSGQPPLATSLDLYRLLKKNTPDSIHYLLSDYFEKNIFWQLRTKNVEANRIDSTLWQVTMTIDVKKVLVDSTGTETSLPMDDWFEIGVYAPWETGERSGKTLYLKRHRLHSGVQIITVTVPERPGRAGVDPNNLLIDLDWENNTRTVKVKGEKSEPDLI